MYRETKTRIWTKVVLWRLIATANSFMVLISALQDKPITNAILMNITGMIVYYWYERIWNNISWGRVGISNDKTKKPKTNNKRKTTKRNKS